MLTSKRYFKVFGAAVATIGALSGLVACGGNSESSSDSEKSNDLVTVYTGRHYGIEPVFEKFTAETGIEVRFTTGGDPELRARLEAEGANTPADLVMTSDAANIALASAANLLSPTGITVAKYSLNNSGCCLSALSVSRKITPCASKSSRIE